MGFPHWFKTAPQVGSLPIATLQWKVWNRTGAASVKGKVYQFDMGYTTTATNEVDQYGKTLPAVTTSNWKDDNSCWKNVVLPATEYLRQAVFCTAEEAVADNYEMLVTVIGPATMVGATHTGDGAVTAGWQTFVPANGVDEAAYITGQTNYSRVIFLSTSPFTVTSSVCTDTVGMFNGFGF